MILLQIKDNSEIKEKEVKEKKARKEKAIRKGSPVGVIVDWSKIRFEIGDVVIAIKPQYYPNHPTIDYRRPLKVERTYISEAIEGLQILVFEGSNDIYPATDFKLHKPNAK